jgi:hypothetical protein
MIQSNIIQVWVLILTVYIYFPIAAIIVTAKTTSTRTALTWKSDANNHIKIMEDLLYPPGINLKARTHLVKEHPIYNFLHTYYRYSMQSIKKYSPGLDVVLENSINGEGGSCSLLNDQYIKNSDEGIDNDSKG